MFAWLQDDECPVEEEAVQFDKRVHDAAGKGDVDKLIQALTTHGHLIDTPSPDDWRQRTPMHQATTSVKAVETLVRFGSKALDTLDKRGCTPLNIAASIGRVDVIETLIRLGSNAIDTPDNDGWTPLYAATRFGHVDVIEALIRLGSRAIDTPDKKGATPLHRAASDGQPALIETLIRLGSQALTVPNNTGWTCLRMAVLFDDAKCVKLLRALDANPTASIVVDDLKVELSADEVVEIRFGVYFARSLVQRLSFEL